MYILYKEIGIQHTNNVYKFNEQCNKHTCSMTKTTLQSLLHVQLNVQTFINREPQCHDPWFQPTDEVLHYVGLLGHFSSLKKN